MSQIPTRGVARALPTGGELVQELIAQVEERDADVAEQLWRSHMESTAEFLLKDDLRASRSGVVRISTQCADHTFAQSLASIARAYPFCSRMASMATLLRSRARIASAMGQRAVPSLRMAAPTGPYALRADSR